MQRNFQNGITWFGILGILAAWACTISDTLLLYSPDGDYFKGDFNFLMDVNSEWADLAMWIGAISIPLMALGLIPFLQMIQPAGMKARKISIFATTLVVLSGFFCHVSFYSLVTSMSIDFHSNQFWMNLTSITSILFALLFFMAFGMAGILILSGKTKAPRWLFAFTPIVTYPLVVLAWWFIPSIGNYLLPAGFNLCVGIFFAGMLSIRKEIAGEIS